MIEQPYDQQMTVFRLKSRAWQYGLTAAVWLTTIGLSLIPAVSAFEFDLFQYMLARQPGGNAADIEESIRVVPWWLLFLVYGLLSILYVRRFTRSAANLVSLLSVVLVLFGFLMLEVVLAVFLKVYLPILVPALLILLLSVIKWGVDLSRKLHAAMLLQHEVVDLADVQERIDRGDLKTALMLLKQCDYSDELLEVGYELGMLLESGKHWAGALNLYHWLSRYDPGLADFVTRIEEIRRNREILLKLGQNLPTPEPELPTLGNYQLLRKIAKGSTSIMYEATDMRSHNRVALKVLRIQRNEKLELERAQYWLHEAEIVAGLDHDNIVKIHDAEILGDSAYIAMDFISGYSMSQRLRRREYLTVGECIRVSRAMLNALTVAHSHGIVHGDIKPANIMFDSARDTYILTDFGSAYTDHRRRRKDNLIVGTPAYMSPEQLEGKRMDGRSDLFSLAVTLYHLLTGHQPFTGDSLPELKRNIVQQEPDLDHLTLPSGITEIISKALQKKPYMRFADAQQMLTSIDYCETILRERMQRDE